MQSITIAQAGPLYVAGTLACTVDPAGERLDELSCSFQPRGDGATARFRGTIARLGVDERIEAQRAVIWLVHGPQEFDVADLEGCFVRKSLPGRALQKRFANGLIGEDGAIALVPPSGREQISGNAALTVIELSLSALRT